MPSLRKEHRATLALKPGLNNDTLYTNAWLDLSEGPLVIEVPDMGERYWTLGFLDMWTNPFAYAGRRSAGNLCGAVA